AARAVARRQARRERRARARRRQEGARRAAARQARADREDRPRAEARVMIDALFDRLLERGGSDLHLSPGYPPMLRVRGQLVADGEQLLTTQDIEAMLTPLLSADQAAQFDQTGDLDFAHRHGTKA